MICTVQSFSIVNETEVDVFQELPCFLHDTINVGNSISGSSASSKLSWCIWKFSVHVWLKPNLKDFEQNFANQWNEHNCTVVWAFLALSFFGLRMKTAFIVLCLLLSFPQICWHIECSTLTASFFRVLHNSARILSPLLALFVVMLPMAELDFTLQGVWL